MSMKSFDEGTGAIRLKLARHVFPALRVRFAVLSLSVSLSLSLSPRTRSEAKSKGRPKFNARKGSENVPTVPTVVVTRKHISLCQLYLYSWRLHDSSPLFAIQSSIRRITNTVLIRLFDRMSCVHVIRENSLLSVLRRSLNIFPARECI